MRNRLPLHYIVPASPGDKLLAGAYGAKISLLRFTDDDGNRESHCEFEITGTLDSQADAQQLLAALVASFNRPAAEEGGQYA